MNNTIKNYGEGILETKGHAVFATEQMLFQVDFLGIVENKHDHNSYEIRYFVNGKPFYVNVDKRALQRITDSAYSGDELVERANFIVASKENLIPVFYNYGLEKYLSLDKAEDIGQ